MTSPTHTRPLLTRAQRNCLLAIHDAGTVVLQRNGSVLGEGDILPFACSTFLRLIGLDMIEFYQPLRMRLTLSGEHLVRQQERDAQARWRNP